MFNDLEKALEWLQGAKNETLHRHGYGVSARYSPDGDKRYRTLIADALNKGIMPAPEEVSDYVLQQMVNRYYSMAWPADDSKKAARESYRTLYNHYKSPLRKSLEAWAVDHGDGTYEVYQTEELAKKRAEKMKAVVRRMVVDDTE